MTWRGVQIKRRWRILSCSDLTRGLKVILFKRGEYKKRNPQSLTYPSDFVKPEIYFSHRCGYCFRLSERSLYTAWCGVPTLARLFRKITFPYKRQMSLGESIRLKFFPAFVSRLCSRMRNKTGYHSVRED